MKILITQFYTDNVSYGYYSEEINKKYCEEKGYEYYCEKDTQKIKNALEDRAATWYKPILVKEVLDKYNPDYVLFLDIDAIISDFNQNVEDFIDSNYNLIFAEDVGHHSAMNAGVFIVKNNEWSKNFLNTWWESADNFIPEDSRDLSIMEENLGKKGYFRQALWHDQTCLTILYENNDEIKNNIKVISNRSLNHRDYGEGNFIFHAFAYGHAHNRTIDIIYRSKFEPIEDKENINLIVYHIYCVGNYLEVVKQQLNRLKTSGLYDWCDKLEITCINTENNFAGIEELIKDFDKATLNKFVNNDYEYEGINKVWEYSQQYKGKVFYFHTKGVSNLYINSETKEISQRKQKGIAWWKEIMEYFLIDNFQDCLQKLDKYDQCGVTNNSKWWWGNFWWTNLSFVRINERPARGDRWYFEAWLNHYREPSYYEYFHLDWSPYYSILPEDLYINKEKYSNSTIEVVEAFYGTLGEQINESYPKVDRIMVDVTEQIKANLIAHQNKGFSIRVDNNIAGDPYFGIPKVLEVYFLLDGEKCILVALENTNLIFKLQ